MRESAALAEPVSAASFRQVLANLASGITVITAYGAGGPLGLTATSFVSVSLAPPRLYTVLAPAARLLPHGYEGRAPGPHDSDTCPSLEPPRCGSAVAAGIRGTSSQRRFR